MASQLKITRQLDPNRPAVLFIPGGMATPPAVFDGIENEIPWQSAVIDWSTSPGPWDIVVLGNRVLELITELDLKRVVLAAYSAGGVMAIQAAIADEEHRIAGMLLSNTGPCAIGHGDPDLPKRIEEQWFSMELFEPFLTRCFSRPVDPALREKMLEYAKTVDKEAVYQSSKTLREHDLRPGLPKITCPVVIAHGSLDKARTLDHVKMLTDGIPDTEVFLLNGGHTIMVEDHDNWVEKLNYLIQKVDK